MTDYRRPPEAGGVMGTEFRLPLILVAEDCGLLAETICDLLMDNGMQPVGPAGSVAGALDLLARTPVDGALVDFGLDEGPSLALCDVMLEQGLPFIVMTGAVERLPPAFNVPVIGKPFDTAMLVAQLKALTSGRLRAPPAKAA
jgi:DNA-binding response OmpR family regulator